jgi:hypothetical protein
MPVRAHGHRTVTDVESELEAGLGTARCEALRATLEELATLLRTGPAETR